MASTTARMHEFHFRPERADTEARSARWMTSAIVVLSIIAGVGSAALGYVRAPALAAGPATAPITRSWQPDPELALASAKVATARLQAPIVVENVVAATPLAVAAEAPTSDSDNPY